MITPTIPDLVCPIDRLYPICLFVTSIPGAIDVQQVDWQCVNDPTHNGNLPLDAPAIPVGVASNAASVLPNTAPPARHFG